MQYYISDGILKHNRTKAFPLTGKSVGNRIRNPCNWQIFPCASAGKTFDQDEQKGYSKQIPHTASLFKQ